MCKDGKISEWVPERKYAYRASGCLAAGVGAPKMVPSTLGGGFDALLFVSVVVCVVTEGAIDGVATNVTESSSAASFSSPADRGEFLPAGLSLVAVVPLLRTDSAMLAAAATCLSDRS